MSQRCETILQICVTDHTLSQSPHIHIMLHSRAADGTTRSSDWAMFEVDSLRALHAAVAHVTGGREVRLHMHGDDETPKVRPAPIRGPVVGCPPSCYW